MTNIDIGLKNSHVIKSIKKTLMIRSRSFRRLMEGLSKAVSQQLQSKEKRSADQGKLGKVYKSTKKFICCKSFICELYLRLLYI